MSKNLLIVESPTKARTIGKYLGSDFEVIATVGHLRDLPKSKMGVDLKHDFEIDYQTDPEKKKVISSLTLASKKAKNIYLATDPDVTSSELEDMYVGLVKDVATQINIPLAVKLSPFISALPNFARRLAEAGARGLVLFNRFYQPDFDLDELEVVPNLVLSNSHELRLPLRWIAILYGRVPVDFALTSGVHNSNDMVKAMMAGASVAMTTSELLQNGVQRAEDMLNGFQTWLEEHEYESVEQMKGSMSQQAVAEPAAFERANYMKVLSSY